MKMYAFSLAILLLASCEKENPPKKYTVDRPEDFVFTLVDKNNMPLLSQPNQKVDIYLFVKGEKRRITDYRIDPFPANYALSGYYYTSVDIPFYSADSGVKKFYLDMNNDIDTIYVDVEKHENYPPGGGPYTYREVRFNGKVVPYESQPGVFGYVFRKR